MGEVADEDGGGFGESEERVFLDGSIGRENAASETRCQGTGKEKVLILVEVRKSPN